MAFPEFWKLKWPKKLRGNPSARAQKTPGSSESASELTDDIEAAQAFLEETKSLKAHRDYVLELERLQYWVFYKLKKPLSKFTYADRNKFEDFLRDPTPASFWCGPHSRSAPRHSPNWKPFAPKAEKVSDRWIDPVTHKERDNPGLSEPSIKRATSVITQYLDWLVREGYLLSNPWKRGYETRKERKARREKEASRRHGPGEPLRRKDWRYVAKALRKLAIGPKGPHEPEYLRLRCLMTWLYYMNPSDEAMAAARDCDLAWFIDGNNKIIIWRTSRSEPFTPKRTIFEWHILHDDMVATYLAWKKSIGWGVISELRRSTEPVFRGLVGSAEPLTGKRLHMLISEIFHSASDIALIEYADAEASSRLRAATDSRRRHLLPTIAGDVDEKLQGMANRLQISRGRVEYIALMDSTNSLHAPLQ